MDKFLEKVFSQWGWLGLLTFFLVLDKAKTWHRQLSGKYVSWNDMDRKIEEVKQEQSRYRGHFDALVDKMERHLESGATENIKMARTEITIENLKEMVVELKESRDKMFSMISDIKNILIADRK